MAAASGAEHDPGGGHGPAVRPRRIFAERTAEAPKRQGRRMAPAAVVRRRSPISAAAFHRAFSGRLAEPERLLFRLGQAAGAGAGARGARRDGRQPLALVRRRRSACGGRTGAPRRNRPTRHDDAGRRSSEGRPRRVFRRHGHAALDVGAVAGVPQAAGRKSAGQPAQVAHRRIQKALVQPAVRRRDPIVADSEGGAGYGAPPKPEASAIPFGRWSEGCCRSAKGSCSTRSADRARLWPPPKRSATGASASKAIPNTSEWPARRSPG